MLAFGFSGLNATQDRIGFFRVQKADAWRDYQPRSCGGRIKRIIPWLGRGNGLCHNVKSKCFFSRCRNATAFSSESTAAPLSQGGIHGTGIPEQGGFHSSRSLGPEVNTRSQDSLTTKAPQGAVRRAQLSSHLTGGRCKGGHFLECLQIQRLLTLHAAGCSLIPASSKFPDLEESGCPDTRNGAYPERISAAVLSVLVRRLR